MIERKDILSIRFLEKTEYTASHKGMRYRLEKVIINGEKRLSCTIWPEPFNFITTPDDRKEQQFFSFDEAGVETAINWMNKQLEERKSDWENSDRNWDTYNKY